MSLTRNERETVGQLALRESVDCAVLTGVPDRHGRCPLVKTFPISYLLDQISAAAVRRQTH